MKRWLCLLLAMALLLPSAALGDHYENWYEIFVYSYQDSDGDGIGDLNGVKSRLDYLQDMGYTGLWLMPITPSPSYHKYDVTNYYDIDSQYGTMDDFRELVDACHQRGIKIIIDMPINHSSSLHPWFLEACDALRDQADSPWLEYYCFSKQEGMKQVPVEGTDWYYEEQFTGGGMPDLNLDSEEVRAEISAIFRFWLTEVGVDGFRLDAVTSYYAADTERNVAFLRWLKEMAVEIDPDCYLVGEAWSGMTTIVSYYESGLDSFFLFPVSQAEGTIARVIRARSKPASLYIQIMKELDQTLPGKVLAPFIGNHDTGRAVGSLQARQSPEKAKFAEGILNMMGGATFTYYGEEIGMVGSGDDPNKRLAMYWNDGDMTQQPPGTTKIEYAYPCVDEQLRDPDSLLNYCKQLNHLKLDVPSIARGKNEFVIEDANFCVMKRTWEEEESYIAINFSSKQPATVELAVPGLKIAGILDVDQEQSSASISDQGCTLNLAPYAILVLVKE